MNFWTTTHHVPWVRLNVVPNLLVAEALIGLVRGSSFGLGFGLVALLVLR